MKKILCFILIAVLSLGVLTSCEQIGGVWDSVSGTVGGFIDGIFGNDQPEGPSLEEAVSFLDDIYKDKNEITRADFDVVGKVIVGGVSFPVTWASNNDAVTVRPSTKTGYYTVDLPDENGTEFSYVLTATIADAEGNTATKSYTFTVPVINNSGITTTPVAGVAYKLFLLQGSFNQRYYALNTTQDNKNKFINTTLDPKESADFFVEPVDGGYKVYTEVDGVKNYIYVNVEKTVDETTGAVKYSKYIGFSTENASVLSYNEKMGGTWTTVVHDLVWGIGTYGTYTTISVSEGTYFTPEKVGDSQFVMQFITAEVANTYEPDELPEAPSEAKDILDKLYALADGESAAGEFKLTGVITALDNYNNPTIVVEGYEDMPVYCYRLTDDRFVVGATISVTALQMKNYGGTYEFMSCTLDSITLPGEGGTETPTLGVVDPVVGTAYKFGMVQQNVGTDVYYLIGGMDGYYMATGTDVNAAIDVYLEETEGGYYLYTLDAAGTKLYINMVVSGTHVNGAYEATASTVYTYNTESKTLVASVQPEGAEAPADYWFGTRNDKTYTTVGPCAVSYAGFYCQFYSATEGGNEGTDTPVDPNPETPTLGVVDPVAGTAYKFGMVQQNVGTDVYYLIGGMDGYYMATGTDVNAAIDVYLEETEGGYYLYTLDAAGTKLYINMVVSGTHVNGAYEATASTVYTYNTESKTLVASVQPEGAEAPADYWFGTRNDKTYTTVGPCAVSYAGFYCQFYGEGATDGEGGESGDTPSEPETVTTIPDALAAAVGTNAIVSGQVIEINQVWDSGWNNMSVTIADADGNELYIYRMGTQVVAGDFITVTGTVGEYNGAKQIAQGSTAVVTGHEDLVVDASCKTLSFADAANRTTFTTEQQVWAANGVTLTNNKAESTSNVADYSAPARFYAKTEVVVECTGMTKITFNLNSGKPASGLTDSLANVAGITVEADGNDITIIFDSAVDSFSFSLVAQIRVDSIDVYTA